MNENTKVPITVITRGFQRLTGQAKTDESKGCLYLTANALAHTINSQDNTVGVEEFLLACGVQPNWKQLAAA